MWLNLREIIEVPGASIPFETELEADNLTFPSVKEYPVPPRASGCVFNEAGIICLQGEIEADMVCVCDRCGEEFNSFKTTPVSVTVTKDDNDEEDPAFYSLKGDEIDLSDILSTAFIFDMETKFLCKEDCKGLCSKCGKNLNFGPCSCGKELDPRFAVLEQLLDKN